MAGLSVEIYVRTGFSRSRKSSGVISIDPATILNVASFAGSFHILSMDQHFDDYMLRNGKLVVKGNRSYPTIRRFQLLQIKERSRDVVGNIGEAIAGIVATDHFKLRPADVAHLKVLGGTKTPDYVLRLNGKLPKKNGSLVTATVPMMPTWWPTESKASEGKRQTEKAFRQLVSYWEAIKETDEDDVGFGLVVDLKYTPKSASASILLSVFMPSDQKKLVTHLKSFKTEAQRLKLLSAPKKDTEITGCLHGC